MKTFLVIFSRALGIRAAKQQLREIQKSNSVGHEIKIHLHV